MELQNESLLQQQKELICSKDFDNALENGVTQTKNIVEQKSIAKSEFERFYDIMSESRKDIVEILNKKVKTEHLQKKKHYHYLKKKSQSNINK